MKFPLDVLDSNFIDLIKKLLEKSTSKRLMKFDDIINHNFFKNLKIETIENMSAIPPYIPIIEKYDLSSLSTYEEILKVNNFFNVDFE